MKRSTKRTLLYLRLFLHYLYTRLRMNVLIALSIVIRSVHTLCKRK